MHNEQHPQAGQTVKVKAQLIAPNLDRSDDGPHNLVIEDWWDHLTGGSWMDAQGNFAAMNYAMRNAVRDLPLDDEVVYGKVGPFGHLVHVSEIVE